MLGVTICDFEQCGDAGMQVVYVARANSALRGFWEQDVIALKSRLVTDNNVLVLEAVTEPIGATPTPPARRGPGRGV